MERAASPFTEYAWPSARMAEGATGALPPGCRSVWDWRPTRHSCRHQIGRASCRERVCPSVSISVVAGCSHNKLTQTPPSQTVHATSTRKTHNKVDSENRMYTKQ